MGGQQSGLLGQSLGSGLQGLGGGLTNTPYTTTWADSTSTVWAHSTNAVNFYPNYVCQAPIPPSMTQDPNDPVAWLKKRVKEIEWRT